MAKDPTDYRTLDFIAPVLHVTRGQVLVDRQRQIAIVVKKGDSHVHLLRVKSGALRLTRMPDHELVADWMDADYSFECAAAKLLKLGRQYGITDAAHKALEELTQAGREPVQHSLFG